MMVTVLQVLQENKGTLITKNELSRILKVPARELTEILAALVKSGGLTKLKVAEPDNPTTAVWAYGFANEETNETDGGNNAV